MRMMAVVLWIAGAGEAAACACCAEEGQRDLLTLEISDFEADDFARVRPRDLATLFVGACDLDCVEGIADPKYRYDLELWIDGGRISLRDKGNGSQMSLRLGPRYTLFKVDTEPLLTDRGMVQLFAEFRFSGPLSASGDFAAADGAWAEVIFSGFGNACAVASELSHWSIDVKGQGADFRIFGALAD